MGGAARLFKERRQHREAAVCHAHVRRRHAQPCGNIDTLQLEGVGLEVGVVVVYVEDVEVHRDARRSSLAWRGGGCWPLGDRREARDESVNQEHLETREVPRVVQLVRPPKKAKSSRCSPSVEILRIFRERSAVSCFTKTNLSLSLSLSLSDTRLSAQTRGVSSPVDQREPLLTKGSPAARGPGRTIVQRQRDSLVVVCAV